MCVDRISENLLGFYHEDTYYKVSMMWPGTIFLYTDDTLIQTFTCPPHINIGGLAAHFKTDADIRKATMDNAKEETDKDKFISEVQRLIDTGVIDKNLLDPLRMFIKVTNSSPETINKQLILRGFGSIGELMNFGVCAEETIKNCEIFKVFLKKLQKRKRHVQETHGDSRSGVLLSDRVREEPDRTREEEDSETHPYQQDDYGGDSHL
jgi:hypothetical protein